MTASVLKQDPNTKRFKRTLIYFNTDAQYAHFQGNPLCQAKQSVCEPITFNFELLTTRCQKHRIIILFTQHWPVSDCSA